jgi:hypothetical protein
MAAVRNSDGGNISAIRYKVRKFYTMLVVRKQCYFERCDVVRGKVII